VRLPPPWSAHRGEIACEGMEAGQVLASNPTSSPSKSKLTGWQKLSIAGLMALQVPSSLIFYPLAALFALTGIGIPLSIIFMGVGTLPFTVATKHKLAWQSGESRQQTNNGAAD
jgi:hypothetical protein